MKGLLIAFLILFVIVSMGTKANIDRVYNLLRTGRHLENARVHFTMGKDQPWRDLPPFIREEIALGHSATKMDLTTLTEVRDYYNVLIKNYKEPVSLNKEVYPGLKQKGG